MAWTVWWVSRIHRGLRRTRSNIAAARTPNLHYSLLLTLIHRIHNFEFQLARVVHLQVLHIIRNQRKRQQRKPHARMFKAHQARHGQSDKRARKGVAEVVDVNGQQAVLEAADGLFLVQIIDELVREQQQSRGEVGGAGWAWR